MRVHTDGKPRLPLFLFKISWRTFQVALTLAFSLLICFPSYKRLASRRECVSLF